MTQEQQGSNRTEVNYSGNLPKDPQEQPEKKSGFFGKAIGKATVIVGGLALAGGIGAGVANGVSNSDHAPERHPAASAPVNPSDQATPTPEATKTPEQEISVSALELPGSLSPEQVGTTIVQDRLSAWEMASTTDATQKDFLNITMKKGISALLPEYEKIAAQNADIFTKALFVPDLQSDPTLEPTMPRKQRLTPVT